MRVKRLFHSEASLVHILSSTYLDAPRGSSRPSRGRRTAYVLVFLELLSFRKMIIPPPLWCITSAGGVPVDPPIRGSPKRPFRTHSSCCLTLRNPPPIQCLHSHCDRWSAVLESEGGTGNCRRHAWNLVEALFLPLTICFPRDICQSNPEQRQHDWLLVGSEILRTALCFVTFPTHWSGVDLFTVGLRIPATSLCSPVPAVLLYFGL